MENRLRLLTLLPHHTYRQVVDEARDVIAAGGAELLASSIGGGGLSTSASGTASSSGAKILLKREVALLDGLNKVRTGYGGASRLFRTHAPCHHDNR